ncbi:MULTISPECIES: DUF6340 family protein [Zobellia]|uniref:DUF6340 family protein n=1 Tax=Zobellia TaxID=112040 RepID=UPI000B531DC0|nr:MULTISPECIES: DUF6340 family protein [Zobellia]MBU3026312.1 hypothetical protein [Zobellia galactanivorans]OWW25505.1 hypothetical protein B4Q04_07775 [Zobellia sp. OII3]
MRNLNRLFSACVILLLFSSCASTNKLTMGATEPARITLPSNAVRIGLINRSIPSEENKVVDKIDKVLSLEGLNLDKEGAESAVTGLFDELTRNERFESITIINDIDVQRKGLGVFPAALNWQDVQEICEANNVDVLFSLEFYDTETKVNYEATTVTIPNSLGIKASLPGHKVTLNTAIKNGWRVYDPQSKLILDEYIANDYVTSVGSGVNPMKAVEAVIGRKEAVIQRSSHIGNSYGYDVRPLHKRISRDYFVKGTDNFVVAKRRAQTGDWDGAAALWEKEVSNPDAKVAGRACYNMAIINEINGDLEKAMEWASKSYTDYNNGEALRYVNILKYRMAEKRQLERQLSR